jgi:hypothetical protein
MERFFYTALLTAVFLVFVSNRCSIKEENSRNRIEFTDSVESVEKIIVSQNALMQKLPVENVSSFFFDNEGSLYVNSHQIGQPNTFLPDTVKAFGNLSIEERKQFMANALFLKKNKITGNHLEGLFGTWIYSYARTDDNSFKNYRGIFYSDNKTPLEDIKQANIILDKKGSLMLFKAYTK